MIVRSYHNVEQAKHAHNCKQPDQQVCDSSGLVGVNGSSVRVKAKELGEGINHKKGGWQGSKYGDFVKQNVQDGPMRNVSPILPGDECQVPAHRVVPLKG